MITITFLGLDPYTAQHISKDLYVKLGEVFHCQPEEIIVIGSEAMLFHNGVDQTLWHSLIHVNAPSSYQQYQAAVAKLLLSAIQTHIIHGAVEFYYYEPSNRIESLDDQYPRYVTESNLVNVEHADEEEQQEIYQGDAFSGVKIDIAVSETSKSKKK